MGKWKWLGTCHTSLYKEEMIPRVSVLGAFAWNSGGLEGEANPN